MFLAQHTSLHPLSGAGGVQSHHQLYGDGADSGTNAARGRAVQVDPMKPKFKPPGTRRLKLKFDTLLSTSGLKFNLRRYIEAIPMRPPTIC